MNMRILHVVISVVVGYMVTKSHIIIITMF